MAIYMKLAAVQSKLSAPKGQYNSFGKYAYRSCEDIFEAVKPLLAENNLALIVSDDVVTIGDRTYIKATATLFDTTSGEHVSVTASAREEESKKGMDSSQVTGATSSYARKYALNGLFLIDDCKDSDATNTHGKEEPAKPVTAQKPQSVSKHSTETKSAEKAPETPKTPMCEKCGKAIEPYTSKDGKAVSAEAHAEWSLGRYKKVYCKNCIISGLN